MITKILSLTIAALFFCSVTVSAAEPEKTQGKTSSASNTTKKTAPSQNTKKTITPAKSAQKPAAAAKSNTATKTAPKATVKKNTTATKTQKKATVKTQQKSTAKKNTAVKNSQKKNTAVKTTPKKTTNAKTAQKATVKPQSKATAPVRQVAPIKTSPAAPINAAAKQVTPNVQVRVLDKPLSQEDIKYSSLLSQAQFSYEQRDYKQALAVMLQAYDIKQEQFVAGNIATLYMLMGDAPNCVRMVRKYKISEPSVISGLILGLVDRGMLYYAKNIEELTESVQDNGSVAYAKGVMYERLRDPEKAARYYQRAVMMSAHNPSYVYALARINDILENYEKAFTLYEDVLALTRKGDLYIHSVSRLDELRQLLKLDE